MTVRAVGIRLEGTPEQLDEAFRRLRKVFHFNEGRRYQSRQDPQVQLAYCRAYTYEPATLFNRVETLEAQLQELAEKLGEVELENERLKAQLKLVPTPKPTDVVLGSKHR